MRVDVYKIKDSFLFHFSILFLAVLILRGCPVPDPDEQVYLLLPIKQYDPSFLLNDWTLSEPSRLYYVFNLLVGPLTMVLPLEIVGWLGRIICWSLSIVALLRLGAHFHIPRWMVTISISLWLVYGQSTVAGGTIFSAFGANAIAHVFLLWSLDALIRRKEVSASVLLGLTFSFHSAVGLWSILSLTPSLIVLGYSFRKICKMALWTFLFSLPGMIFLLPQLLGTSTASSEQWQFLALVRMPHHLDPLSWPRRNIFFLYLLLAFNWLHFRSNREDQVLKLSICFQMFLCLWFSIGTLCRLAEYYSFLRFFPFRLFPVFTLLFFFFHLMSAYYHRMSVKLSPAAVTIAFFSLLSFGSPIAQSVDRVRASYCCWTQEEGDIEKAFKWVEKNTPIGSTIISPPWRRDAWYLTQRAQVASYPFFSYDDQFPEWRERIESMIGKIGPRSTHEEFKYHYNNKLTEKDIDSITEKYGGEYLVSKGDYLYPVLFETETYKVYLLKTALDNSLSVSKSMQRLSRKPGSPLLK